MAADAKITLTVDGAQLAQDTLAKVGDAMKSVGDTSSSVTETAHGLRDALTEAFENPISAIQSLGAEVEHALGPIGAVAGVIGVAIGGMTAAVVELGERGSEVDDVRAAFDRFSGSAENATAVIQAMRTGVVGTISDFTLMKDANHLMAVGALENADDFGTLTQAARVLSHDGFGSVNDMLDTVSGAMETGRIRALARMGVTVDQTGAEAKYAESMGVTAAELSTAGKLEATRQAIMEALRATVSDAGEQELTFAERIGQMRTAMSNANDSLSAAVATSPVLAEVLKTVGDAVTSAFGANQAQTIQTLVGWINQGAIALVGMAESGLTAAKFLSDAFYGTREIFTNIEGAIVGVGSEFAHMIAMAADVGASIPGLGDKMKAAGDAARDWQTWLDGVSDGLKKEGEQAIDTAGSHDAAVDSMSTSLESLRQKMITASQTSVDATSITRALGEAHGVESEQTKQATTAAAAYEKAVQQLVDTLEGHNKKEGETVDALQRVAKDGFVLGSDSAIRFTDAVTKLVAEGVFVPPALLAMAEAERLHVDEAKLDVAVTALQANEYENLMVHLQSLIPVYQDWAAMLPQTAGEVEVLASTSLPMATGSLTDFSAANLDAEQHLKNLLEQLQNAPDDINVFASSFDQALQSMPNLLEKAFSGGSVEGAVTSLGSKFGTDLGKSVLKDGLGKTLTDEFGDTIGGALGAAIPGVGALIGPLIGELFSIGGPSAAEQAGRKTEAAFEQGFGGFTQMMGTVGAAYATAGLSAQQAQSDVASLMSAEKQGTAATQAAIDTINANMAKGTAAVAGGVQSILDAAKIVGSNFPTALQPVIAALLQSTSLTDAEKTSLEGLANAGQPAFSDLTAAAGRYGLTLDTIGGKAAQLSISTEADQIESDYKTLVTTSGADSDKVLAGMKTSLNDLVNHALNAGDVLPTAIQPLIEQLLKTGQLTDDAGASITDLSKLKFDDTGDPLATGMTSLTDAINNLSKILGGLPATAQTAAAGIGSAFAGVKVNIPVSFDTQGAGPEASAASTGGYVTSRGVVYAADGFPGAPSGTDTIPAWLTPGEAVLNRSAVSRLGRDGVSAINHGATPNAGSSSDSRIDALTATMKRQGDQHAALIATLPMMIRHAVRGAR